MFNTKEYTSTITLVFDYNNGEAESVGQYIKNTKEYFYESFNIKLANEEITNIQEVQNV